MTDNQRPARRSSWAIRWAYASQGVCFAALVTRIPTLQTRFDLTDGSLALLLALVPVVAGVGSLVAGSVAARWGSRTTLRVMGPVVPIALVLTGAAGSLGMLVAALVVVGAGLGAVDATMNMQGVSLQSRSGTSVIASLYAAFSLAGIVGAAIAALAAATDLSLAVMFAAIAVVVVPVQLVLGRWLLVHDVDQADITSRQVPWGPLVAIGIAITAVYVIDSSVSNWSAVLLTKGLGSAESVAALAYGGYAAATLIGRTIGDRQLRRFSGPTVVRVSGVAAAVSILAVVVAPAPIVGLVGFALLGLALCLVLPLAFVAADAHDPANTGVAVARVNVFNYVGFVLGAPLVGALSEVVGLRLAFAALIPVALLLVALANRFVIPTTGLLHDRNEPQSPP